MEPHSVVGCWDFLFSQLARARSGLLGPPGLGFAHHRGVHIHRGAGLRYYWGTSGSRRGHLRKETGHRGHRGPAELAVGLVSKSNSGKSQKASGECQMRSCRQNSYNTEAWVAHRENQPMVSYSSAEQLGRRGLESLATSAVFSRPLSRMN